MKVTVIPERVGVLGIIPPVLGKETGENGNQGKGRNPAEHRIVKIGLNTEKSPGSRKGLAITQIPVKDHELMPVWKPRKEWKDKQQKMDFTSQAESYKMAK